MKATANERGLIETGFARISAGFHRLEFMQGIGPAKDKDTGEPIVSKKNGVPKWNFPMVANDPEDADHGLEYRPMVYANDSGEEIVASFLGGAGLYEKFAKKFPGKESMFEDAVAKLIMTQLPGHTWTVILEEGKPYKQADGSEGIPLNIVFFGKENDTEEKLTKLLAEARAAKKGGKATGAGKATSKVAEKPEVDEADPFA